MVCVFPGSKHVVWLSKKKHVVNRSTIEVKYWSSVAITTKLTWLNPILSYLHFHVL